MAGIIHNIKGLLNKANPVGRAIISLTNGQPVWSPRSHAAFVSQGYQGNSTVYACIRLATTNAGRVPWYMVRRKGRKVVEVDDHPVLKLLARPNPTMGRSAFIENWMGYLMLTGDAFTHKTIVNGKVVELWPLRPDRIIINPAKVGGREIMGLVDSYTYKAGQVGETFPAEMVWHSKTWNPADDWRGMSCLQAAAKQLDVSNAALTWNAALLQNGARPSGWLHSEENLTDDERKVLERTFVNKFTSAVNAGRPIITEGSLKWHQVGLSPTDMDFINAMNLSDRQIANAIGVPPQLLGLPSEGLQYSTQKEAMRALFDLRITPMLEFFRDELNAHLVWPHFGEEYTLEFDRDAIPGEREAKIALMQQLTNPFPLTVNEARHRLGEVPVDGGDVVFIPSSLVPLNDAVAPRAEEGEPRGESEEDDPASGKGGSSPSALKKLVAGPLETAENQAEYWKAFEKQREPWDKVAQRMIEARFKEEGEALSKALNEHLSPEDMLEVAEEVLAGQERAWKATLAGLYLTVGDHFARQVFEAHVEEKGVAPELAKTAAEEAWLDELRGWLASSGGEQITGIISSIRATTLKKIAARLTAGVEAGEGAGKLADRIRGLYGPEIYKYRAYTIARTEVATASNRGSRAGARATGLDLEAVWITTLDDNERTHHRDMNNKTTGLDDLWQVFSPQSGRVDNLEYPAAANASADNRVNCRCVEGYQKAKPKKKPKPGKD